MTLQFYLLPYLEQFHEQYPGIKIMVTNATMPGIKTVPVKETEDIFIAGHRFMQYKNKTLELICKDVKGDSNE